MNSSKGPLLIIAAAIIWNGAGIFWSAQRHRSDDLGMTGAVVACVLLIYGFIETRRER